MIVFVIVFSLFFYYKSSGLFFLMMAATSFADWLISKRITRTEKKRVKKIWVFLSLCLSLGILGYFKYANFFLINWNAIVQQNFQPLDIVLPVGISFYTFQSVSYIIDVYKGRVAPTRTWLEYLFYLSFFPQLVAGPIVRADYFLPQIGREHRVSSSAIYTGLWLVLLGIIKKAVVADYIAQYNDLIFNSPTAYSGFENLMGIWGYTMQIYCDFSGYSDMAIGITIMMGFDLGKNFNYPYQSRNLTEFWRRWHISLSSWLRDYVYIPLGGNRKGIFRTYLNNFLTMLIGGLWHGAAWKFVFWGGMHGVGLMIHKAAKPWLDKLPDTKFITFISWFLTFSYVSFLWVFFRAASFEDSWKLITHVFTDFNPVHIIPFIQVRSVWCIMMTLVFAVHFIPSHVYETLSARFSHSSWLFKLCMFIIVVQLVIQFRSEDVQPFIYFQF